MLISSQKKFIFVHNPKVAGSSIRGSLQKYQNRLLMKLYGGLAKSKHGDTYFGHLSAFQIKQISLPFLFDTYYKFGFVRNPWDREVSTYTFILGLKSHPDVDLPKVQKLSFKEYLHWRINERYEPQKPFFYDHKGNLLVDFIGRFEDLAADFSVVKKRLTLDTDLTFLNKSKKRKSKRFIDFYDEESLETVYDAFREDCDFFNYKKPSLS